MRTLLLGICLGLLLALVAVSTGVLPTVTGFSGWEVIKAASDENPSSSSKTIVAHCSPGKKVIGGGAAVGVRTGNAFSSNPNGTIYESGPVASYDGWQASAVDRNAGDAWGLIAYAICANIRQ